MKATAIFAFAFFGLYVYGSPGQGFDNVRDGRRKKIKLIAVCLAVATLAVAITRPVAAADLSCAQWLAYRMGDTSMKAQGLVLITFVQGYIDAVNEFGDLFNGNLGGFAWQVRAHTADTAGDP